MKASVFYVQYEARPTQQNELWGEAGGAFVHCYCLAAGPEAASRIAFEAQEHFDTAASTGECFVYYLWPAEPQEGETC